MTEMSDLRYLQKTSSLAVCMTEKLSSIATQIGT